MAEAAGIGRRIGVLSGIGRRSELEPLSNVVDRFRSAGALASQGTSEAPPGNGVGRAVVTKPAAGRASSRMKAEHEQDDQDPERGRFAEGSTAPDISVESTRDRYIRAIHAHGTVPYGAGQARGPLASGARSIDISQAPHPTPAARLEVTVPSGARVRPSNDDRPDHDRRSRTAGRRPPQHRSVVVCQWPAVERPDQSTRRSADPASGDPGPGRPASGPAGRLGRGCRPTRHASDPGRFRQDGPARSPDARRREAAIRQIAGEVSRANRPGHDPGRRHRRVGRRSSRPTGPRSGCSSLTSPQPFQLAAQRQPQPGAP